MKTVGQRFGAMLLAAVLFLAMTAATAAAQEAGQIKAIPLDLKNLPIGDSQTLMKGIYEKMISKEEIVEALTASPPEPDRKPYVNIWLHFKVESVELADDWSWEQLVEAGEALSSPELQGYLFEVAGHTDSTGDAKYNRWLSNARAEAVRNYFIEAYGIDPDSLLAVGYGEDLPVADNGSREGRSINRRVVITRMD